MTDVRTNHHTTVRRLTAPVSAAIAVIAVHGPHASKLLAGMLLSFSGRPIDLEKSAACFARWRFKNRELADEHVVVLVREPGAIEICCHGGLAITDQILLQIRDEGAALDDRHEPILRPEASCWLNDETFEKCVRVEAECALMNAATLRPALIFLEQFQGALARECQQIRASLRQGHEAEALKLREVLVDRGRFGLKLLNSWRLALAGPPNVGKSSLTNKLCGSNRVLVHHEPGTTRDAIDTDLVIGGWPIKLTDTAGIRDSKEAIEQQGIAVARERWSQADIGLLVVDAEVGWTSEHNKLLSGPPTIFIVLNKIDRLDTDQQIATMIESLRTSSNHRHQVITASASFPNGTDEILEAIRGAIDSQCPAAGCGVPFTAAQLQYLMRIGS